MRFFVDTKNIDAKNNTAVITGGDAKHITGSLRLDKYDIITVCDGSGMDYACEILDFGQARVSLRILNAYKGSTEPDIKVTLFQAFPKHGKMELIIEKCVELGVYEIVPMITRYTVLKTNDKTQEKIKRYNKIAESAAKQCNRGIIPAVKSPVTFDCAMAEINGLDIAVAAWEKELETKMKQALDGFTGTTAGIMIGPEGGFSDDEARCFQDNHIKTVSLGRRILRTETAGMTCLTIFFNETGEI